MDPRSPEPTVDLDEYLQQVRLRRSELGESMSALEALLADTDTEPVHWSEAFRSALRKVHEDLEIHVAVTERPGGLYDSLRDEAARLAGTLRRLQGEHPGLLATTDELLAQVADGATVDPAAVREPVKDLLRRLGHHRQRGADLIFEAYEVDVGGVG